VHLCASSVTQIVLVCVAILLLRLPIHASCPETFVLGSVILTLRPAVRIHIFRFMDVFVNKLYIIQFKFNGSRKEGKNVGFYRRHSQEIDICV
jgi:hypothetical protein